MTAPATPSTPPRDPASARASTPVGGPAPAPDPALAALLARAARELTGPPVPLPPLPPAAEADPAVRVEWAAQVACLRARHDALALEAAALLERAQLEELGPDPFALAGIPLERGWDEAAVPGGSVGLRWYRPAPEQGAPPAAGLPVIALVHGGGFWMGGGATGWRLNDPLCSLLAARVGALVVSIDHRLAPEHPFPVPGQDVLAGLARILELAPELGGDPGRLALYGISSGGNLVPRPRSAASRPGRPSRGMGRSCRSPGPWSSRCPRWISASDRAASRPPPRRSWVRGS